MKGAKEETTRHSTRRDQTPGRGDGPACLKIRAYGVLTCPRSESAATYMPALIGELVLGGAR